MVLMLGVNGLTAAYAQRGTEARAAAAMVAQQNLQAYIPCVVVCLDAL